MPIPEVMPLALPGIHGHHGGGTSSSPMLLDHPDNLKPLTPATLLDIAKQAATPATAMPRIFLQTEGDEWYKERLALTYLFGP